MEAKENKYIVAMEKFEGDAGALARTYLELLGDFESLKEGLYSFLSVVLKPNVTQDEISAAYKELGKITVAIP